MPSSIQQQPPHPWASIAEALNHLTGLAVHCVVGVVIGVILARQLHARHLRWSWAAVGCGFVLLARIPLGGSALTVATASLLATARARRWHREDLDAGADMAEIAADRRGPLDLLRSVLRALRAHERSWRRAPAQGAGVGAGLTLGEDERGRPVSIPFGGSRGGRHTLVVGATGSGKTVTQTAMAVRAVEHGMGAVVIDPKGDRGMRTQLARAACAADRRYIEWTPTGVCVYNPYADGSDTEIADKVLAGERFTEPHYLRQAQRYLGHVVRALRGAGVEVSLSAIVQHLDPDRLEVLARRLTEGEAQLVHRYLDALSVRQRSDLAGVRDRLAILVESDVGRWLDPETPDSERLDLLAAVRSRAVVYFALQSDQRPLLTQMLGAAIVQDLQTTVAALQDCPVATLVVIDEFSALAAERVVGLFGRARSAGLSLLLGTQELTDLRVPGRERLLEQVMGNLSAVVAHRQVVPSSAELISGLAGSRGVWKVARHSDGRTTRTRTREPLLNPDRVTGLQPGWAAVIAFGDANSRARITHVHPLGKEAR
jgi:conjugal transfer pilus assembly protein TraD